MSFDKKDEDAGVLRVDRTSVFQEGKHPYTLQFQTRYYDPGLLNMDLQQPASSIPPPSPPAGVAFS